MGLAAEMKKLSEELLVSFKNRISANEELVTEVQKTLDGFRKDHQEMTDVLNANAATLRKDLATGKKERLQEYSNLMSNIHQTIASVQQEVTEIKKSTVELIQDFSTDRAQMAVELDQTFVQNRADRVQNENTRMQEFDQLMKEINSDITRLNKEVMNIFQSTNNMLVKFEAEHVEMSAALREELRKNLTERIEYTRTLLTGFQKKLAEIGKENLKMAQKLKKDLAAGETERMKEYNGIMKGIHLKIKAIRMEVKDIAKYTDDVLEDLLQNRVQAGAEWSKMKDAMEKIRKTGAMPAPKPASKKAIKSETKMEAPVQEMPTSNTEAIPAKIAKLEESVSLEERVLDFINKHPQGVKVSEMEEPLGEQRMKLGFTAKALLYEGKVQKMDNTYFPLK